MTGENIKTEIAAWCNDRTGLQLVEDRSEPGADFALGLRTSSRSTASVPVDVRLDEGDDRVRVSSTTTSGADAQSIERVLAARPALIRGDSSGGATVVAAYVYTDGFNKQAFINAVEEVAKTRSLIDALSGAGTSPDQTTAAAAEPQYSAAAASQPQAWQAGQPTASTLPAPSFASPSPGGGYTPLSGQPAPQAQPAAAAFAPTHTVPPQGLQAWAAPDPTGAVVATLGGGLPIQVTEVRGAWANIVCSNGWTGWVDGRIIGVAR